MIVQKIVNLDSNDDFDFKFILNVSEANELDYLKRLGYQFISIVRAPTGTHVDAHMTLDDYYRNKGKLLNSAIYGNTAALLQNLEEEGMLESFEVEGIENLYYLEKMLSQTKQL